MFRCPTAFILLIVFAFAAPLRAELFETRVRLEQPKKESKRSAEGGREHVVFRLWLPDNKQPIRGMVFNPYYTKAVTQEHWQAACRHWNFGLLAANFFGAKQQEFPRLVDDALNEFAKTSQRAGVADAPLCPVGMSAGAGMSVTLASLAPERVIAVGPVCLEVGPRDEASMQIPMLTVFGERDGKQYEKLMAKLPVARSQDARFGIAVQWRRRHEFGRANNLIMLLFDAAIRKRLRQVGQPLAEFPVAEGWLGDVSAWKERAAEISPYAKYAGEKSQAVWLPDAKTAHAWRAFVTHQPQLELREPAGLGDGQPFTERRVGEDILIRVKHKSVLTSTRIRVFAGEKQLGQFTPDNLSSEPFTVRFAEPGFYPLYVEVEAEDGTLVRSRPNTIIVSK